MLLGFKDTSDFDSVAWLNFIYQVVLQNDSYSARKLTCWGSLWELLQHQFLVVLVNTVPVLHLERVTRLVSGHQSVSILLFSAFKFLCKFLDVVLVFIVLNIASASLFAVVNRCLQLWSHNTHLSDYSLHSYEVVEHFRPEPSGSNVVLAQVSLKIDVEDL